MNVDLAKLPDHVAIIMDGNGRWAKKRGLERLAGHRAGSEAVEHIITHTRKLKIPYLTLYAFSHENWERPEDEVEGLMQLLSEFLVSKKQKMLDNGICFKTIGNTNLLPDFVKKSLDEVIKETSGGKDMTLVLALSYGSRDELVRAFQKIFSDFKNKNLSSGQIDENTISGYLDTKNIPDPDLIIRTGGDHRLSNFLLWQAAYAELYFTRCFWPDFNVEEYTKALLDFQKRERRFGKVAS